MRAPREGLLPPPRLTRPRSYDSKAATGCVGLKNQGATCYMNSLLQTLFHLPAFRRAVYHMPTVEADTAEKSIPLALQSLFYKLQFGGAAASTKRLTASFGWDQAESFQQHDVQELNRVLCDNLEEKMKGTVVEGALSQLFQGHTRTTVQCSNVPYVSQRTEPFLDLQLDVRGCCDVRASFARYCAEEVLQGENAYAAEGHGMQDAVKGVRFLTLPPVLQLQLKRFEYDPTRDAMCKVHDRYEFPIELDLSDFMHPPDGAAAAPPAAYRLHSVLVHSGGVHGGHYYVLINPECAPGGPWLKFDDERVTLESEQRALEDNFGEGGPCGEGGQAAGQAPLWRLGRVNSAYMLVYVRSCDLPRVACPVGCGDLAPHVRQRLEEEASAKATRKRDKAQAHLFSTLRVARLREITLHVASRALGGGFDLMPPDWAGCAQLRVPKDASLQQALQQARAQLGLTDAQPAAWWAWQARQNHTYRPSRLIEPGQGSLAGSLRQLRRNGDDSPDLRLFLEEEPGVEDGLLLFFKHYDPAAETLTLTTAARVSHTCRVAQLRQHLPPTVPADLLFFEEVRYQPELMVEALQPRDTVHSCQLEHGDIVLWQRSLAPEEAAALRFPRAPEFLAHVLNRLLVNFRELGAASSAPPLVLELSRDSSYDDTAAALAGALGLLDPQLLRFTGSAQGGGPRLWAFRFRQHERLPQLLAHAYGGGAGDTLFYETLDTALPALEALKVLNVELFSAAAEPLRTLQLRLPRGSLVHDALAAVALQLAPEDGLPPGAQLQLVEVWSSRVFKVLSPDQSADLINDSYWRLRCEAVPEPEAGLGRWRVVQCCHLRPDCTYPSAHGHPFLLPLLHSEPLSSVQARVAVKLALPLQEVAGWKWAMVAGGRVDALQPEDDVGARFDSPYLANTAPDWDTYLGMEHTERRQKRGAVCAGRVAERAIRIFG